MNWLCCLLALLQAILALDYSRGAVVLDQQQTRLSFIQHAKCTYTYEVAVHTARGARSTASDGFRVHALVSLFLKTYFSSTHPPPPPYKFFQLQIFMYDSRILHFVKELVLDGLAVFSLNKAHDIRLHMWLSLFTVTVEYCARIGGFRLKLHDFSVYRLS